MGFMEPASYDDGHSWEEIGDPDETLFFDGFMAIELCRVCGIRRTVRIMTDARIIWERDSGPKPECKTA